MQRRIRCFVAVDIEDDSLRASLVRAQEALLGSGAKLKLVEPANLHITLKFLGEISETLVEEVIKRLDVISFKSFKMVVRGLGAFPRLSNPRVIWAGISEGATELQSLAGQIEAALKRLGFRRNKEFKAHLTLARVKRPGRPGELGRIIREYGDHIFGSQIVRRFKLKRSILTSAGPIYSDLAIYEAEEA